MCNLEKYEELESLVSDSNKALLNLRKDFMIEYMRQGNPVDLCADLATEAVVLLLQTPDMSDYGLGS